LNVSVNNFYINIEYHIGEALGLLSALEWVHELSLGPIDFEFDVKRMTNSFLSHRHGDIEFGVVIQNCKTLFT